MLLQHKSTAYLAAPRTSLILSSAMKQKSECVYRKHSQMLRSKPICSSHQDQKHQTQQVGDKEKERVEKRSALPFFRQPNVSSRITNRTLAMIIQDQLSMSSIPKQERFKPIHRSNQDETHQTQQVGEKEKEGVEKRSALQILRQPNVSSRITNRTLAMIVGRLQNQNIQDKFSMSSIPEPDRFSVSPSEVRMIPNHETTFSSSVLRLFKPRQCFG